MIVSFHYYVLLYSFNWNIHELFWLMNYSVLWNTEIQNQQAGAELKQIECTKPLNIGFFVAFFDTNNSAFRKTNSSGKNLDTRQKIFCAALLLPPKITKQINASCLLSTAPYKAALICGNPSEVISFMEGKYITKLPWSNFPTISANGQY